ncbi:DUF3916 domain-containing protein [Bacillus gaemokensis]|uniref:DUF3916 domain-containing protein n=1 Tax=Bacillus gaemokensis TaxID=574375 RepID=A0A073KB40_9BACI|nr:DUF3916 domain-containing protein [Bacillus gaemokensis]KEK23785.1 hypothetical protein BAGA_06295 [Bacillus gaemokensis]KYG38003.1 hypothetical protein AZF08_21005 [Bacillus gaemokensis]
MKQGIRNNRPKKKIRSLRRACRNFLTYTNKHTSSLPNANEQSALGCWSIHLPFHPSYMNSQRKSNSIKRFYLQTAINRLEHLIDIKTTAEKEYRIYFVVSFPNLHTSNILIVFSKQGIERFFEGFLGRYMDGPQWISLPQERDIEKEFGLLIPKGLQVKGYTEIFTDADYNDKEIWFIGELD